MGKKKGKALALELVGDLFDKSNTPSKKAGSRKEEVSSEQNSVQAEMESVQKKPVPIEDNLTEKLSETQISSVAEMSLNYSQANSLQDYKSDKGLTVEAVLNQSENLKKAQDKILQLETVIEGLRKENEQLLAATATFKKSDEEQLVKINDLKSKLLDSKEQFSDEKNLILEGKYQLEKTVSELKLEIEQLQSRLNTNLKKIRVRERELENRLEIVKLENVTLLRSKDEHVLQLKRQLDDAEIEIDRFKQKGEVLDLELEKNKNMLRKTVKALRLALTMLEMDEHDFKKASGEES